MSECSCSFQKPWHQTYQSRLVLWIGHFTRPEHCSYSAHVHTSSSQIHISAVLCAGQQRDFFSTSVVGPVYYTGSDLRSIKAVELPTLGFKQCCSSWGLPVQNHRTNVRLVKVTTDVAGTGSLYSPSCSGNKCWLSQNPVKT